MCFLKALKILVKNSLMLLIAFLNFLIGQSQAQETINVAYNRVVETGVLRCGYASAPPYVIIDPNTRVLSGIQYDIVNEIGRRLELKVDWVSEAGFSTAVSDLKSGKYDMFCNGLTPTGVRSKYVDFTQAPFAAPFDVWVRNDDHRFDMAFDLLDSETATMSVMDGTLMMSIHAQSFPKSKTYTVVSLGDENVDMLMAVATGKADFTVMERTTGEAMLAKNPNSLRRLLDRPIWVVQYAFPVAQGNPALVSMINTALGEMQSTGILDKMLDRYALTAPHLLRRKAQFE